MQRRFAMDRDGNAEFVPSAALLGCGIFARDGYVPIIKTLHRVNLVLTCIWSRSQRSAEQLLETVRDFAPEAEAKWGEDGLREILSSRQVHCCLVVLPVKVQPAIVLRAIGAGKHVLQEKPVAENFTEGSETWLRYKTLSEQVGRSPIWAVGENYRFETAFHEAGKIVKGLGTMAVVEIIVEVQMLSSNKYFDSQWRRDLKGGFIMDCGVHFVAGLRLMTESSLVTVRGLVTHRNKQLPAPDTLTALLEFQNGCSGVMVIAYASSTNKAIWRVVCAQGTVEVERAKREGNFGYTVTTIPLHGSSASNFFPFVGMQEEMKCFATDVKRRVSNGGVQTSDWRSSPQEALRDLEIVEAALRSNGETIQIGDPHVMV